MEHRSDAVDPRRWRTLAVVLVATFMGFLRALLLVELPGGASTPRATQPGSVIPVWGDEHVDDLAELVDRTVDVAPLPGDLDVGVVDLPTISHQVAAGSGNLGQQRREPHHPPVDRDVIDLDAPLGEQFLDVAVGQAKAQVPADRQDDDVRREPEACEGGQLGAGGARQGSHADSLGLQPRSPPMQQSRSVCR
jgi:hypothetical protein